MYEKFNKLLERNGVTAYKVAKETGVTTATLTSWKQGKYVPKQEKLQKLADYFGVTTEYLLGQETEIQPNDNEIKELNALIRLIPISSIKFLSYLCKNRRIIDDYTEKSISKYTDIALDDYLSFENDNRNIGSENILKVLHFLEFNPSYIIGLISGILLTLENKDNDLDLQFEQILNNKNLKEQFLMINIFDPDKLNQLFNS